MNNDLKQIKSDLGDITGSLKQMLVLTWVNANAARREDILTELETVAAKQDIQLIKEVILMISQIASEEETKKLVSQDYYKKNSIQPAETFTPFAVDDAAYFRKN